MRIGHDGTGRGAGWHLDKVIVRRKNETNDVGKSSWGLKKDLSTQGYFVYTFLCNRWLATDEDDAQIVRDLVPVEGVDETRDEKTGAVLKRRSTVVQQKSMKSMFILHRTNIPIHSQ